MVGKPCFIAIVDDDAPVLKALKRLLCGRGFEVATYMSAREFLQALPESRVDRLILDLQMPDMDGYELLRHLKHEGIDVPTIVITAHADAGVATRCRTHGAIAFLSKPLQLAPLLAAIEKARCEAEGGQHSVAERGCR